MERQGLDFITEFTESKFKKESINKIPRLCLNIRKWKLKVLK